MTLRIVGLVSSFREGKMLETAVKSLGALDGVLVAEGPVEQNAALTGPVSVLPAVDKRTKVFHGEWGDDAEKRSWMVERAQKLWPGELWGLWLDGDELLLWGEYLHDWLGRAVQVFEEGESPAGWPFTLVELDGTTTWCLGKLVRVDLVEQYLISSSYVQFVGGVRRTIGNVDVWTPLDGATMFQCGACFSTIRTKVGACEVCKAVAEKPRRPHWRARPPLQGEPHLQHRSMLRDKLRTVERQGQAEERNYRGTVLDAT